MNVEHEVARAAGDRPVLIPTPYVSKNGRSSDPQQFVHKTYDLFFDLTGGDAHFPMARNWSHVRVGSTAHPKMFFMQLMLLLCEHSKMGSVRPKAALASDPKAYWNTVVLSAASIVNTDMKPHQRSALKELVHDDFFIDRRFMHHVEAAKAEIAEASSAPKPARNGKRGAKSTGPPQPPVPTAVTPPPDPIDWTIFRTFTACINTQKGERRYSGFEAVDTIGDAIADHTVRVREHAQQQQQRLSSSSSSNDTGGVDGDGKVNLKAIAAKMMRMEASSPYRSADGIGMVVPKIQFTVTPVVKRGGNAACITDVAGIYLRWLVRDPSMDPGVFFHDLLTNVQRRISTRRKRERRDGHGSAHVEMFPQYAQLYPTTHPVSDNLSKHMYYNAAIELCPELHTGRTNNFCDANAADFTNPMHPHHILTPANAMRDMMRVHDTTPLALEFTTMDWWRGDEHTAYYPQPNTAPTYVYHPQGVFWHHDQNVGMREQLFPHVQHDSDIMAELIAGGSLDQFVPRNNKDKEDNYVAVADEQSQEQRARRDYARNVFEELRAHLEDNWTISRKMVLKSTLVQYVTDNEFVHRAAEAKIIRKRIAQEFPAHSIDTLSHVIAFMDHLREVTPPIFSPQGHILDAGAGWRAAVARPATEQWLRENLPNRVIRELEYGTQNYAVLMRSMGAADSMHERVQEYDRYAALFNQAQEACNRSFVTLWQVQGNTSELPIPATIRAMLDWYRNNANKLPHMTRQFLMWDPEMGIFGNSTLRMLEYYVCVSMALQPTICLMGEALFSCYRWSPGKLATNQLYHGRYDVGKSFLAIETLLEYTCIPGTVEKYTSQTAAADTTYKHVYDQIVASDEVAPWKVSKVAAAKNEDRVNKEKVKLTDRQVGHKVFTNVPGPDGRDMRWSVTVTTDHYAALVEVTNAVVEAESPLSSRYFRMTVARSQIPARKLGDYMKAGISSKTSLYFQMGQFLCAAVYKCIQCGGMLEPDMTLFDDLSNRIVDVLADRRAIKPDQGRRILDIMKPYAITATIRKGIHCCYDIPGGENYKQPFDASAVRNVQPYLYCDEEIVWWCWTVMSSAWIEEKDSTVIKAACSVVGVNWPAGTSAYTIYSEDLDNRVPFRLRDNKNYKPASRNGDDKLVDLNYITLEGGMERICHDIADKSFAPRLHWTDVKGILFALREHAVTLEDGGYLPQPRDEFSAWHRFLTLPTELEPDGTKKIDPGGADMPQIYRVNNPNSNEPRTEKDVPRMAKGTRMTAVDDSELAKHGRIYIMPGIAHIFQNEEIITALRGATMCRLTRPGKILTGFTDDRSSIHMRSYRRTQAAIDEYVTTNDKKSGWNERGQWCGNEHLPPDTPISERPVPYYYGITNERYNIMGDTDKDFFTIVPMVPVREGEDWKGQNEREIAGRSRSRKIYGNVDDDAAHRWHVRCGRPLDEPVRTTTMILERARKEAAKEGVQFEGNVDYPHDTLADYEDRRAVWNANKRLHRHSVASLDDMRERFMADSNKPREESVRARLEKRREQRRKENDFDNDQDHPTPSSSALGGNSSSQSRPRQRPPPTRRRNRNKRAREQSAAAEQPPAATAATVESSAAQDIIASLGPQ